MKFKEINQLSNAIKNDSQVSYKSKNKNDLNSKFIKTKINKNNLSNKIKSFENNKIIKSEKDHVQNLKINENILSNNFNKKNKISNKQTAEKFNTESLSNSSKNSFTRINDYFKKTSKSNQNVAGKALAGFLCGFILFFSSIHLICWNERRAVRECQYIDCIREEKKCKIIENGGKIEKIEDNLIYIINGNIVCEEEPKIEGLDIEFNKKLGVDEKLLMLKINFEKFCNKDVETRKEIQNENGEEGEEIIVEKKKTWINSSGNNDLLDTKVYFGKVKKY